MTQRESRLSRTIANKLKDEHKADLFVFKVWGSEHMMAGLPDLIGCYKGTFFAFETKTAEGKASRRQEYVMGLIKRAGGIVAVVRSVADALDALP